MAVELKKVQVPRAVSDGLTAVEDKTRAGGFGMSDVNPVIRWLGTNSFPVAAGWVEKNIDLYCKGLVAGFEKDGAPNLKKPDDYTDAEKCAKFDELFRMAEEEFDHSQAHGYGQKDGKHYIFETVMSLLGGQEMWDAYNS